MTGIILSTSRAIGETAPLIVVGALAYVPFIPEGMFNPVGFQGAIRRCTDCTLRGTNVKPDFWID